MNEDSVKLYIAGRITTTFVTPVEITELAKDPSIRNGYFAINHAYSCMESTVSRYAEEISCFICGILFENTAISYYLDMIP